MAPQPLSGVPYLGAFASLSLAVAQEAGEERQVDAVVQGQQEVLRQLEARGMLGPQLPDTVQEEQEDRSLQGRERWRSEVRKRRSVVERVTGNRTPDVGVSPPLCRCPGGS